MTDVKSFTGEQLAEIMSAEYEKLLQSHNNIRVISAELVRRRELAKKEAEPKEPNG